MADFRYKLKEIEVGDVTFQPGVKSTVTNIDPETNTVEWDIDDAPNFSTVFKNLKKANDLMKKLVRDERVSGDKVMQDLQIKLSNIFNSLRTHVRKNYPDEYNRIKNIVGEINTISSNSGFNSGTKGENYATPNMFNPNKKAKGTSNKYYYKMGYKEVTETSDNPGATMGPGAKAGPDGVKNNAYVKQFKFKLAPKPKSTKAVSIVNFNGKTSPLNEADINVEEYINNLGIESSALKKHITSRVLGFDKVENKLNELIPLLAQAKNKTMDYYRENPDFKVVYGTDLAVDYLDDLIEMFKD